jgi:pyrroloquinoline quinone biosynthesis protein A
MIYPNARMEHLGIMRIIRSSKPFACNQINQTVKETIMWTKPEVTEMRFGFEVTMYVCNR